MSDTQKLEICSVHEQVGFSDGFNWETHCSCGEKFGCDDDGARVRWYEHKTETLEAEINWWACLLDRATKECDQLEAGEEWYKAAMEALNGA